MNGGRWSVVNIEYGTFPHSVVCHLAHGVWLQLRTLGSDGGALRQAASLTFMVKVADISCLQCKSRV